MSPMDRILPSRANFITLPSRTSARTVPFRLRTSSPALPSVLISACKSKSPVISTPWSVRQWAVCSSCCFCAAMRAEAAKPWGVASIVNGSEMPHNCACVRSRRARRSSSTSVAATGATLRRPDWTKSERTAMRPVTGSGHSRDGSPFSSGACFDCPSASGGFSADLVLGRQQRVHDHARRIELRVDDRTARAALDLATYRGALPCPVHGRLADAQARAVRRQIDAIDPHRPPE